MLVNQNVSAKNNIGNSITKCFQCEQNKGTPEMKGQSLDARKPGVAVGYVSF